MKIHFFYLSIISLLLAFYFCNKPNKECISQCSQDTMCSAMSDIQTNNELILKELEMEYQAYRNIPNARMYSISKGTDSIATVIITEINRIETQELRDKKVLENSIISLQERMRTVEDVLYNGLFNLEENKEINEKWNRQLKYLGHSDSYLSDFMKLNEREKGEELVRICLEIRHKENYVLSQNRAMIGSSTSCRF